MQPDTFVIGIFIGAILSFGFGYFCGRLQTEGDKESDGMARIMRHMIGKIAVNETYSVSLHVSRFDESDEDDGGSQRQPEPEFEYWRKN